MGGRDERSEAGREGGRRCWRRKRRKRGEKTSEKDEEEGRMIEVFIIFIYIFNNISYFSFFFCRLVHSRVFIEFLQVHSLFVWFLLIIHLI